MGSAPYLHDQFEAACHSEDPKKQRRAGLQLAGHQTEEEGRRRGSSRPIGPCRDGHVSRLRSFFENNFADAARGLKTAGGDGADGNDDGDDDGGNKTDEGGVVDDGHVSQGGDGPFGDDGGGDDKHLEGAITDEGDGQDSVAPAARAVVAAAVQTHATCGTHIKFEVCGTGSGMLLGDMGLRFGDPFLGGTGLSMRGMGRGDAAEVCAYLFAQNRCASHMRRVRALSQACALELDLRSRSGGECNFDVMRQCMTGRGRYMDFYMELAQVTYYLASEVARDGDFGLIDEIMDGQVEVQMPRGEVWQREELPFLLIRGTGPHYDEDPLSVRGSLRRLGRRRSRSAWRSMMMRGSPEPQG